MKNETDENCLVLNESTVEEVPITKEQYGYILKIQNTILEMIAARKSRKKILDKLCFLAESLLPNSVSSIMLKDVQSGLMDMIHAPSVPPEGIEKFKNLRPGPGGGSCGNAVYHNKAQYVKNTFTDPRWEDLRSIAYDFNLCSCWSVPVLDENKNAIGTFALSSFEHRVPSAFHKILLDTASSIVSIVFKNSQNENRIKLFTTALEYANEGVIISNEVNDIIEVNKRFMEIYGYTETEILGKNPRILSSKKYTQDFYEQMWSLLLKDKHWSGELVNKTKDGVLLTQWVSISLLYDEDGTKNYLAIFTDLTELKTAQARVQYLAYHDTLTGLENKAKLELLLADSIVEYTLIYLDINNFNYINGAYGFEFGDKLLCSVSEILLNKFGADKIFRINSDEFALVYIKDIEIENMIKDIQKYFYNNSLIIEDILLNISFNYGVCKCTNNALENVALALKISKDKGKNRYHIFDARNDTVKKEVRDSFVVANRLLHDAISNDMVVPYFQGIVDNKTNKIVKYEALVRIKLEDKIITPFEFLDAAKLSGLLPEITKIMIDKSFAVMKTKSEGFSLNITEDDLGRNYLLQYLEKKLTQYNIEARRVTLEILEGVSSHGKKNNLAQLNMLKERGFLLAIDDFGAEYSNFERILDLDIDFLKIDSKYIKNIDTDKKSYEIVKSIANFAHNSGISCIAEFVHTKKVQEVVESLGIRYSQGYYFSQPHKLS